MRKYRSAEQFAFFVQSLQKRPQIEVSMQVRRYSNTDVDQWFMAAIRQPKQFSHVQAKLSYVELHKMLALMQATEEELKLVDTLSETNCVVFLKGGKLWQQKDGRRQSGF